MDIKNCEFNGLDTHNMSACHHSVKLTDESWAKTLSLRSQGDPGLKRLCKVSIYWSKDTKWIEKYIKLSQRESKQCNKDAQKDSQWTKNVYKKLPNTYTRLYEYIWVINNHQLQNHHQYNSEWPEGNSEGGGGGPSMQTLQMTTCHDLLISSPNRSLMPLSKNVAGSLSTTVQTLLYVVLSMSRWLMPRKTESSHITFWVLVLNSLLLCCFWELKDQTFRKLPSGDPNIFRDYSTRAFHLNMSRHFQCFVLAAFNKW